jgi:hypothetical protein
MLRVRFNLSNFRILQEVLLHIARIRVGKCEKGEEDYRIVRIEVRHSDYIVVPVILQFRHVFYEVEAQRYETEERKNFVKNVEVLVGVENCEDYHATENQEVLQIRHRNIEYDDEGYQAEL